LQKYVTRTAHNHTHKKKNFRFHHGDFPL
jgi:hypothetical protein